MDLSNSVSLLHKLKPLSPWGVYATLPYTLVLCFSAVDDEEGVQGDSTAAARSSLEPSTGCRES